jgi:hypothetical protein
MVLNRTSLAERLPHHVDISKLVNDRATPRVQQKIVGLIPIACAFEKSGGDKATGLGGPRRDMAADLLKHALHRRDGFSIKSVHLYSLQQVTSVAAGAKHFRTVEDIRNTTLRVGRTFAGGEDSTLNSPISAREFTHDWSTIAARAQ